MKLGFGGGRPNLALEAERQRAAGNWPEAAKSYWLALDRYPNTPELWVQYGHMLKELRDLEGSERAYRRALELAPRDWDAKLQLGHVLKLQGRFEEARQAYREAGDLRRDTPDIVRELSAQDYQYAITAGNHARDHQQWPAARAFYAMAVAAEPDLIDLWNQIAEASVAMGDTAGAEEAYARAQPGSAGDAQTWADAGHAWKRDGGFNEAIEALARAIVSGDESTRTRRELDHLTGLCVAESDAVLQAAFVQSVADGAAVSASALAAARARFAANAYSSVDPTGKKRRHARLTRTAALRGRSASQDILWLPNIDWGYRRQRAQHLAAAMAAGGRRVFFISPTTERAEAGDDLFRLISNPAEGVFEVRLRSPAGGLRPLDMPVEGDVAEMLAGSIRQLCASFGIDQPLVFAQQPNWVPIVAQLPRWSLVYDCLDDQAAFPNASAAIRDAHDRMVDACDLVVTTSQALKNEIGHRRPSVLVRNAASPTMFEADPRRPEGKPVVGYFGALAEWFDMDWVVACAKSRPEWRFVLAGEIGACNAERAVGLANVVFLGEVAHDALPALMKTFSVGVIPFKISRLTEVTDPVKLYEYIAGGCPVVTSEMPEVIALGAPGVLTASSAAGFEAAIAKSLKTDSDAARRTRVDWASGQTWAQRASAVEAAMRAQLPLHQQAIAS